MSDILHVKPNFVIHVIFYIYELWNTSNNCAEFILWCFDIITYLEIDSNFTLKLV